MFRWLSTVLLAAPFSALVFAPSAPIALSSEADEAEAHEVTPPAAPSARSRDAGGARRMSIPATVRDGMVSIPGGRFPIGTRDPKAPPNERPLHSVTVRPFQLDLTEVTVADYRACVERRACAPPMRSSAGCTFEKGEPQLPINCVTWTMAHTYCQSVGKRLPHETEWEVAAHGPDVAKYPWGGNVSSCATATTLINDHTGKRCSKDAPSRVGSHPLGRSVYGVEDMSGNVEEWTADYYSESLAEVSPTAGASRAIRGGGWLSAPSAATTTIRGWGSSMEAGPNVGFRCAKDAPGDGGN